MNEAGETPIVAKIKQNTLIYLISLIGNKKNPSFRRIFDDTDGTTNIRINTTILQKCIQLIREIFVKNPEILEYSA